MKRLLPLFLLWAGVATAEDSVTLARLRGADTDLPELLPKLFRGDLVFEDAYLYTLSYIHDFAAYEVGYARLYLGAEGVLGRHSGIQDHVEAAAAFHLRLEGMLPPASPVNFDYGIGDGLSYAFGEPVYEDTPDDEPGKHYRLQNFISMDLDIYLRDWPQWHALFRLHHRSGVYGLVAPPKVGSNFIGFGVKYHF